jgi:tetrahydrodipicolinate N-succinyltransferase
MSIDKIIERIRMIEKNDFNIINEVTTPGSYTKKFPAGEYQVPCALIIGKRKASTDLKTSLNDALREHNVAV